MLEKLLPVALTLIVACIFLTGYSYLDGYYDYFDVYVGELGLDLQNILVHAAPVYSDFLKSYGLPIAVITILVLLPLLVSTRLRPHLNRSATVYISLLVAVFIFLSLVSSHSYGMKRAAEDIKRLNRLVVASNASNRTIEEVLNAVSEAKLYHLITTETTVYGVIQFSNGEDRWVVRIPRTELKYTRVYQESDPLL